jgi:hypothetical protein
MNSATQGAVEAYAASKREAGAIYFVAEYIDGLRAIFFK